MVRNHGESLASIARTLGVYEGTVRRAYDHATRDAVAEAVQVGKTPDRGRYRRLSPEALEAMERRLRAGHRTIEIAGAVGCSQSQVNLERNRLGLPPRPRGRAGS